jgi:U4/U6 small nuclear ribonucleoprotein PRP31
VLEIKYVLYRCFFVVFADIKVDSVRELAKLRDSPLMQKVTSEIDKYSKVLRKNSDIIGPVESDPEYQLIVEANNLAVEIDTEIGK